MTLMWVGLGVRSSLKAILLDFLLEILPEESGEHRRSRRTACATAHPERRTAGAQQAQIWVSPSSNTGDGD